MSKISFDRFKTIKELQTYCQEQYTAILKLQVQAEAYQSKIEHLEELLRVEDPTITIGSSELEIAKIELARLYNYSLREPLDDKQIRAYKIFTDCILAIQGKSIEKKPKEKEQELTSEELITIALREMPKSDEQ